MMEGKPVQTLLVEDDPGDADLIREMLLKEKESQFSVEWIERLSVGIERIQQEKFDVVLLDLGLPESQGLETYERLREVATTIPVLVLTVLDDQETAVEAVRRGAQDYLVKGQVDGNSLTRAMRHAIERKRIEKRLSHLNTVLRAIYNINQLITKETDIARLLKRSCEILVESHRYRHAWIATIDEDGHLLNAADAGLGEAFQSMVNAMREGDLPPCMEEALTRRGIVMTEDSRSTCADCALNSMHRDEAITIRLESLGKIYGVLSVCVSEPFTASEEEQSLLEECAGDIAFALHTAGLRHRQKLSEEALSESEVKFRALAETTPAATFIHKGGKYLYVNPAMERISGYTRAELLAMDFWELVHPDDRKRVRERGQSRHWGNSPPQRYESAILTKDGKKRWIDLTACPIEFEGEPAVLGTFFDITERKTTEDVLRQKEERERRFQGRLRTLHEVGNELSAVPSFDDLCRRAVELGIGRLGFERLGIWFFDRDDPETIVGSFGTDETGQIRDERGARHKVRENEVFRRFLAGNEECVLAQDIVLRDFRGNEVVSGSYVLAGLWDARNLIGYVAVDNMLRHGPITSDDCELLVLYASAIGHLCSLKRAEEALRRSEERHKVFFETSADGILISEVKAKAIKYANPAICRMLGYSQEELIGLRVDDIHPAEKLDHAISEFNAQARGEKILAQGIPFLTKEGHVVHTDVSSTPAIIDGEKCNIAIVRDMSKQKELEEQLRQSQKMEAIGRLASGIAHDFNNILMVINGYGKFVLNSLGEDDPRREDMEEVLSASQRAASLTHQLLAFSRRQVPQPAVLNLNRVIADTEKMLGRLIGEDVELVTETQTDLWCVEADLGQIEQILMNLAVNARDAMPQGGRLTITTQNVYVSPDDQRLPCPEMPPGAYVSLSVSDTGVGMDDETKSHLFEPFFTTKAQGKGTGLGLATVYGIVSQSQGYISVESESQKGATFRIFLPRTDKPDQTTEAARAAENARGTETILVVEDELQVCKIVSSTLRMIGYKVETASDAEQALALCRQHAEPIHLLITDVILPDMHGGNLAERLAEIHPETKVLYMSGYVGRPDVQDQLMHKEGAFLQKPFTPDSLTKKVREILDKTDAQAV